MTDEAEFDWRDAQDEGAIVQQSVLRVAVYTNPHDDVVIRQERDEYDERDTFIIIGKGNLLAVITKLHELAIALEVDGPIVTKRKPLTSAERQRRYRERHKRNAEGDDDERNAGDGSPMLFAAD
jgi:hypothetical protein